MKSIVWLFVAALFLIPLEAADHLAELIQMYTLDEWGYLEMEWNLGSSYDNSKSNEIDTYFYNTSNKLLQHSLDIELHRHAESEQRYSDITVHPSGSWSKNISHYKNTDYNYNYGTDVRDYSATSDIEFTNREYLPSNNSYFAFHLESIFNWYGIKQLSHQYESYYNEYNRNVCNNNSGYSMDNEIGLGMGVGRMREVTNVVRAQRMAQRLQSISGTTLTDEQILKLARWLEKQTAYGAAHNWNDNASDYYFWQSALTDIGIENINFDQFLYLTQEAREGTILARHEGMLYEMGIVGAVNGGKENDEYKNMNSSNTYKDFSSTKIIETGGGLYFNITRARNLSGTSQITFIVPAEVLFLHTGITETNGDDEYSDEDTGSTNYTVLLLQPGVEYLVQVTDRLGITWDVTFLVESTTWESDMTDRYTGLSSGCECTYYLGNNLKLVLQGFYERLDYHNDDVLDSGLELSRNWGFGLQLQWRPLHKML